MYTATEARNFAQEHAQNELDERLRKAVSEAVYNGFTSSSVRVYREDVFCDTIKEELEKRGFTVMCVPDIILKGDVDFSW